MPDLGEIAKNYGDRVGFIALLDDYAGARERAAGIAEKAGIEFAMFDAYHDELSELQKMCRSGYVPTSVIIDREGKMIGDMIIGAPRGGYAGLIDDALGSPAP